MGDDSHGPGNVSGVCKAACVCGATSSDSCQRPVGMICVRDQDLAAQLRDEIVMRCANCGKPKPNDAAWARTATCCGQSRWTSSLTFTETPDGPVVTGDIRYGLEVPDA